MRLYRALLYFYPAAFRVEYGDEMCHVFASRRAQASTPLAVLALWAEAFVDALSNGLRLHADLLQQDLAYSWRTVRRAPGFALSAVVIMALGVGASTAVYSITDHVLIRPLPFVDTERLVKLWESPPGYSRMELSPPNYLDWRAQSTSFEGIAAFHTVSANLVGEGEPQRLDGAAVTADLFPLLGVKALRGRALGAEDARPDAPGAVVLSHGLWHRAFGGERAVLGQQVRLDEATYTVVGVMPPGFFFPRSDTAFWLPKQMANEDLEDRDNNYLQAIARLKPGVSLAAARSEIALVAAQLETQYPEANAKTGATVMPLRDELAQQTRLLLTALFGAAACMVLIACTNLANLFLARALSRRKELTVRTALGAGRERLARQLLTECLALTCCGGVAGVLVAVAALPLLGRLVPTALPLGEATALDPRVLLFALGLTLVTGLAAGFLPALRLSGDTAMAGLREGPRGGVGGRKARLRAALVIVEVAASVVLLVTAGLLIRALWQVQAVDPGFRSEGVLTLRTPLPMSRYGPTAARAQLYEQILSEVEALPGVQEAAYISFLPLTMRGGIWPLEIEGLSEEETPHTASLRFVTPDFFTTLGIPIIAGRDVQDADTEEQPDVAVVSQSFVQRYWPQGEALGQSFGFAFRERRVVGVVGDIRVRGLERSSEPQVYLPYQQVPDGGLIYYAPQDLAIHTSLADPRLLLPAIRRIVRQADPELPLANVRLLADIVAGETAPRQTQIRVLAAFAFFALLLAGIGIYSLLSFAVAQRTSEIGVRMAMGARYGEILGMVLREGAWLATVGGLIGLALAYAAGRSLEALLAGVRPADGLAFSAAIVLALVMTLSGSLLPALRAARVDPTIALRAE